MDKLEYVALAAAVAVFALVALTVGIAALVRLVRAPSSRLASRPAPAPAVLTTLSAPLRPLSPGHTVVEAVDGLQRQAAATKIEQLIAENLSNPYLTTIYTGKPSPSAPPAAPALADAPKPQ